VLLTRWDPDEAVRLAAQEGATFSMGPTVFLQGYVERYEADPGAHPHRLGTFMCGGSAIAPSLIERADAVGIRAFRSWGMTEAPTVGLIGPDDPLDLRAHRDGRLSEGCEVEAVDERRAPLPPGELGELRLRCPEQMLGYTDAALDAEQVDAEGWFYTGDMGRVDAGGWVTMTGRLKDVVNRGGEKFSAQDIEHAIASHPAVRTVAVTGLPDERLGECVAAFVVLRDGAPWPGRQVLLDHLEAQRLARAKFPAVWRVVEELPMTVSGKVQKNRLVALWEAEPDHSLEPA
jgi:acyl-CoA synthetase (AMP-forming)/AMP-acid ligase II